MLWVYALAEADIGFETARVEGGSTPAARSPLGPLRGLFLFYQQLYARAQIVKLFCPWSHFGPYGSHHDLQHTSFVPRHCETCCMTRNGCAWIQWKCRTILQASDHASTSKQLQDPADRCCEHTQELILFGTLLAHESRDDACALKA
jgi:hypothetical protein